MLPKLQMKNVEKDMKRKLVTLEWIPMMLTKPDNVDLWPAITSIHVGMYLVFSPSRYTGDDLLNYKSMDCYKNFLSGWVKEILVKAVDEKKRVVIAKVGCCSLKIVASYLKLIIVKFNCILG